MTAPGTLVVRLTEYDALSTPPLHVPPAPRVLAETGAPSAAAGSTPEYRETAITAFVAVLLRLAVTGPAAAGAPLPCHTSTRVWPRPPHCARTSAQLSPSPATARTAMLPDLVATAARYSCPAAAGTAEAVDTVAEEVAPPELLPSYIIPAAAAGAGSVSRQASSANSIHSDALLQEVDQYMFPPWIGQHANTCVQRRMLAQVPLINHDCRGGAGVPLGGRNTPALLHRTIHTSSL